MWNQLLLKGRNASGFFLGMTRYIYLLIYIYVKPGFDKRCSRGKPCLATGLSLEVLESSGETGMARTGGVASGR